MIFIYLYYSHILIYLYIKHSNQAYMAVILKIQQRFQTCLINHKPFVFTFARYLSYCVHQYLWLPGRHVRRMLFHMFKVKQVFENTSCVAVEFLQCSDFDVRLPGPQLCDRRSPLSHWLGASDSVWVLSLSPHTLWGKGLPSGCWTWERPTRRQLNTDPQLFSAEPYLIVHNLQP